MNIREIALVALELEPLAGFYGDVLGLPLLEASPAQLRVQCGASALRFGAAERHTARYHFAFNIGENQIEAAAAWLRDRVPLIADASGREVYYSESWDAHNVYFRDPAGNILELIARHTLANGSARPFSSASVLNISEIGVCVDDVRAAVAELGAQTGAAEYQGPGSASFSPVGDEHGLLIVVERGRIWFPETGVPAEPLPLAVTLDRAGQPQMLRFG